MTWHAHMRQWWKRGERARAVAQIPLVIAAPVAEPALVQRHVMPPPTPAEVRRASDLDQQHQWADVTLDDLRKQAAHRDPARERPPRGHDRSIEHER